MSISESHVGSSSAHSQPVTIDSFSSDSHERRPLDTPTSLPDLTGKIVKLGEQYIEAGGYGDIYKCQYNSKDGVKEVAVKTFRFKFSVMESEKCGNTIDKMIRRELGIWRRLSHLNIVPFLGIVYGFGREASASLVSLWMPNGTLSSLLTEHDVRLTITERLQLLLGVANGLAYLHSFLIVHGDLSCNNVLVDQDGTARLADFGYASLIGEIPEALAYLQMSTTKPGAIRWAAPEHFSLTPGESIQRTTKSDIYSFGNIALMVLSGKPPWAEHHDMAVTLLLHFGHKPNRPQSHPIIEDEHWGLIEHCWSSIHSRPHASDVVSSLRRFLSPSSSITSPSPSALTMSSTASSAYSAPTRMHTRRKSSIRNDVEREHKKGDEEYIRLENAFILFRRKSCEVLSLDGSPNRARQADLARTISQRWRELSPEERLYWNKLAREKKMEHEQKYPKYIYRPLRTRKDEK